MYIKDNILPSVAEGRGGGVAGGIIYNSIIENNYASHDGSAAVNSKLYNCKIINHTGAWALDGCQIENCLVANNNLGVRIYEGGTNRFDIINTTIVNNNYYQNGAGGGAETRDETLGQSFNVDLEKFITNYSIMAK